MLALIRASDDPSCRRTKSLFSASIDLSRLRTCSKPRARAARGSLGVGPVELKEKAIEGSRTCVAVAFVVFMSSSSRSVDARPWSAEMAVRHSPWFCGGERGER